MLLIINAKGQRDVKAQSTEHRAQSTEHRNPITNLIRGQAEFFAVLFLLTAFPNKSLAQPTDIPSFFSYHAVPYPCSVDDDCPQTKEDSQGNIVSAPSYCHDNVCKRLTSGYIITNNYVARSTRQGSSGCYRFAKYHSFQTLNAYLLDDLYNGSVSISLTDYYGEVLSETMQCQAGPRTLGFMAQPGEIYYVEVTPLLGFDEGNRATFQMQTAEGFLDPTSSWTLPIQPTALEMASGGELGLLLLGNKLKVYDLVEPANPLRLSTQNLSGFPRDLAVSGGSALVASLGPGPDLTAIDIRLAASPNITGSQSVTGPGRRVATWGGYAYVAGVTKVSKIRLFGGTGPEVEETLHVGGPVTALFAHGGRLFVGTHKTLQVYDIQGESLELLSETEMDKVASSIVVHGDTVHVAEMRFFKWLQCMLGFSCSREGVAEVYLIQEDETLAKVGEYEAGATSLPYLRWSGAHAFALGDQNVTGWRAETVE